ncbi:MAG: hypothetical protein K8T10_07420 [Candidatus Eremiobacteraeota bacterium]|nr:hypothetical protein [Candidatus Eremiobacteraeota bacterium]
MNIRGIGASDQLPEKKSPIKKDNVEKPQEKAVAPEKGDRWEPRIIVGAPAGRLSPQIPPTDLILSPIAVEIDRGIGIGIDGESIIVAPYPRNETVVIDGKLEDGLYPQREYTVNRQDNKTDVDGLFDWQDYKMVTKGETTNIKGETDRESITVVEKADLITIDGKYPVQKFKIQSGDKGTKVDGFEENFDAKITHLTDNKIQIKGNMPERTFTVTKEGNTYNFDGHYAFQKFQVTVDGDNMLVKGFYPHQKFNISRKPS